MFASIDSTLPRRTKNKCGGFFFFLSLLFNSRRSLKKTVLTCSAVSSPSLGSSEHTMCCQSVCGWIPGDGPEDKTAVRYVMSAKVRRRRRRRRVSLKLYVLYRRLRFSHVKLQPAGGQHVNVFEVFLFHAQTIQPEVLNGRVVIVDRLRDNSLRTQTCETTPQS